MLIAGVENSCGWSVEEFSCIVEIAAFLGEVRVGVHRSQPSWPSADLGHSDGEPRGGLVRISGDERAGRWPAVFLGTCSSPHLLSSGVGRNRLYFIF